MRKSLISVSSALLAVIVAFSARAQNNPDVIAYPTANGAQTETDEYTRYELLAPETASFRIYYELTATTAGATSLYNPIRKGSVATDESVTDAMTGKPLHFEVVHGADARRDPLMLHADLDTDYIKVTLARPVPVHGQGRVIIMKTYKDPKSYFTDAAGIVFNRPLGVKRNKVVLPSGYEITGLTVASQILTESDGRLSISFMHTDSGEAPLVIHAVKDALTGKDALPHALSSKPSWESPFTGSSERGRLAERAHGDRDIVYFLQDPQTHSFSLYHDYTESRPGINSYANVVRTGSQASNPSAYIMDTGEQLKTLTMTGEAMTAAHYNPGEKVEPEAQVVVIPFTTPVVAGQSIRLRISETYTAPVSYRIDDGELTFDRSLGRPRNAVVLPSGWYVTASAIPATVSQLPDGRVRLDYWDDAPEAVDVLLKARHRIQAATDVH